MSQAKHPLWLLSVNGTRVLCPRTQSRFSSGSLGPLRAFVARCRDGQLVVTGFTIEHGWVLHPLIVGDLELVPGWTISEPASGCRIAYGRTIAFTRARLAARIEEMGGIARFLAEVEQARDAILGSMKASSC